MIHRWGISWKVGLDHFDFQDPEGNTTTFPYLSPHKLLEYFVARHPEVVLGGFSSVAAGSAAVAAFWRAYKPLHPGHRVYSEHGSTLPYVLPIAVHGDEGRGKRRANTSIISIEAILGIFSAIHHREDKLCSACQPEKSRANPHLQATCKPPARATAFCNTGQCLLFRVLTSTTRTLSKWQWAFWLMSCEGFSTKASKHTADAGT